MDEQRSAAISDSANISTSAIIPPESGVRGATAPSRERSGFTSMRLVLGVLLLATAGLKLFDPSPDTLSGLELLSSPRWQMAAIEAEALLGLWLLSGALPRLLWLAALLCFSLLASVSLYFGIEGQPSCGCFGAKLPVSPWYALGLDLAAMTSLIWWRPRQGLRIDMPYSATLWRVAAFFFVTAVLLIGFFVSVSWFYGSPSRALRAYPDNP